MSSASLREHAAGELLLGGVLDADSGPTLRAQGLALIKGTSATTVTVDCSSVEKSSSVGLALLLAFMRDAAQHGKELRVRALPDDMRQIAEVCQLLELLPLEA
ncbi:MULTISPECIES: STAS domain-containing protein [Pseudomonas]|uniref:STAS domain-containing protein n=1 Tax=Serpens gallinarum TaxID=2763075 RepID=A0ABR8TKH1_9PSED|nr:STAS domain-containing protein [Serpens gallinarum]MBD7976084.1 STAS domain-containing protein [Serpens gallinarum]